MRSIKLTLLTFVALVFATNVNAQSEATGDWCKTDQHNLEMQQKNPDLILKMMQLRQEARDYIDNNKGSLNRQAVTYVIPVVVHNITHDGGLGYVSKADIEGQLLTMNEDFNLTNTDFINVDPAFAPYADMIDIEFRLAHLDPNGNCTEGIVRMEHSSSANFSDGSKSISYWDSKKYFNIWLVDFISGSNPPSYIAGYAQFPWSGGIDNTYGVVVDDTFFGPNASTMTHEAGHCFGLLHTHQSGCGSNCGSSGDQICDTPPVSTAGSGCPTTNTCSNDNNGNDPFGSTNMNDNVNNHMSYNSCRIMYTIEQVLNMEFYLNSTSTISGLAQLNTPANRAFTGTADPYAPPICAPVADFTYNKEYICEGGTVTFADNSYNALPTTFNWTFIGGTPSTSSAANPTITYNTAGVYGVTHQPGTTAGNDTKTKTNIITVSSLTADYVGPIIDGFESTTQFNNDWWILNDAGQAWQNNNAAATTGSRSVRINNYFTGTDGQVDELISPSFDISATTTKTMTFKQAYVRKTSADTDKLMVYYSTNCGATWILKLPLTVTNLKTAADQTSLFTPGSGDWIQRSISISAIGTSTNVRFKFAFTSGGGNNIFIDDINIGDYTIGIEDFSSIGSFSVYPNPTNSSAQISFNLTKDVKNLTIKVRNAVGQEVTNVVDGQSFNSGKYTLKIDEERKLSSGIYFVEFNADNNIKVQKLIVQ